MASVDKTEEQVTEQLQKLKIDTQCSQSEAGDSTEVSSKPDGNLSDCSVEASPLIVAADVTSTIVAHESGMDAGMYYVTNGYAAPHGFYYGGYDFPVGDWEDFSRHMGVDGLEVQSPGVYGDNGSVVYHPAGYAYAAHPLYGPYPPGAPISVMAADGQSYGGQPYPYAGHLYQPPVPPGGQFLPSASPGVEVPTSSAGDAINMGVDGGNGSVNGNNVAAGPRPGYPVTLAPPPGPYGRGILPMNGPSPGLQDVRIGNEGPRAGAPWSDATKMTEIPQRHATSQPLPLPALSGQALQSVTPILTHIPATQQHRPPPGVAAAHGTLNRAYQPSPRPYSGSFATGRASQGLGANGFEPRGNGRGWIPVYKGKPRGRGNGAMYNGNGSLDILNEQNRGPRTIRIRNHRTAPEALRLIRGQGAPNGTPECPSSLTNKEQYNLSDFRTNYDNAKFFIIKSYSEDDIHKSIKYNVWASTPNGNKKLDAAYQDAQEKTGHCPLFLFFSVNASGQFCGVAEMVGPVDFNKSMDFWQQDKWSGKFSVKWHIVKDVPNSQFRHIILENNENKPVTNSRDTQEVRFEQGLEMLNLFNSYAFKTSILDDFQFYDNRQKVMQEKRARQQAYLQNQQGLAYGSSNENQPRHSLGEIQCKLQEEKLFKAEDHLKSGRAKDNIDSNSTSESQACNGVSPGEVSTEKPLLRPSEKGELTLAGSSEGENISNTH